MTRFAVAGLQMALCALAIAAQGGCSCHRPGYYDPHAGILYEDVSCAPLLGYGFTDRVEYTFNKLKRDRMCACTSHCGPMGCPGPAAQCAACGETYFPGATPTFGGPLLENGTIYTQEMPIPHPGANGPVFYGGVMDGGVVDGAVPQEPAQPGPNAYDTAPPQAPPTEEAESQPVPDEPPAQSETAAPAPLRVEPPAAETPPASASSASNSVESAGRVTQVSAPPEPPKLIITPRSR